MQQPDCDRRLVGPKLGEQIGDVDGVGEVGLARPPGLLAVHLAGELVDRPQQVLVARPPIGGETLEDGIEVDALLRPHRRWNPPRPQSLGHCHHLADAPGSDTFRGRSVSHGL